MKGLSRYLDIIPGDLREIFELAYAQAMRRLSLRAHDLMSMPVVSVDQDTLLTHVARVMAQAGGSRACRCYTARAGCWGSFRSMTSWPA